MATYEVFDVPVELVAGDTGGRALYGPRETPTHAIYDVYVPPEVETPDTTAPVIDNFDPAVGSEIARTDPIQFDVTDDSEEEFAFISIIVRYTDGVTENIYNGSGFSPRFLVGSAKVAITGGYRFTIRRTGGWLNTPIIMTITAIDSSGNVGTGEFA
jgi:hypothetical protein